MPQNFQNLMARGAIAQSQTLQQGEASAIVRGQVTSGEDEQGLQRHTATTGGKAGLVDCPPASRLLPAPHWSPPQFSRGQTVLLGSLEGDGHNLSCLGVELNEANQAPAKQDLLKDDSRYIPGEKILLVAGGETRQVDGGVIVISGSTQISIEPGGLVKVLADTVKLSGNLQVGGSLTVTGGATVKGKDVAVLGAKDTRNDTLVDSGQ